MSKSLVIIGAGGFGRETVDLVGAINRRTSNTEWEILGVVDDAPSARNVAIASQMGIPHLGNVAHLLDREERPYYVVGIGSPHVRRSIALRLAMHGFPAATLVHPDASVGTLNAVGEGSVLLAGARLTTNIVLGKHVHVNPNVTIGHDTVIEDFVSLNPACSVSGDCRVCEGVLIGVGAVVLNQRVVGRDAVVGAGACVTRDVASGAVVVGVPAAELRSDR